MALQPSLRPLLIAGRYDAPHTLDVFLDYVCPYSAKMARALDTHVKPLLAQGGAYDGKLKIILRPQVQPWHASSTFAHEAALAVARVRPEAFWPFSLQLFAKQTDYYDAATEDMTPKQIRASLAALAAPFLSSTSTSTGSTGDSEGLAAFKALLTYHPGPNSGVPVTDDLKYTIKFARQNGVHVSPSVLWDGLFANETSSSWAEKEWHEFLAKRVVA